MPLHGTEQEAQRRRDYLRTELMSLGERLRSVEEQLKDTTRRLDLAERMIQNGSSGIGSGAVPFS